MQVFQDLHTYMASLQKILDLKPSIIYPAHGAVVPNPINKLTYYIEHRMMREKQILEALQSDSTCSFTPMEIVEKVYTVSNHVHTAKIHLFMLKMFSLCISMFVFWEHSWWAWLTLVITYEQ